MAQTLGWDQEKKLQKLPGFLTGAAQQFYLGLVDDEKKDWATLTKTLIVHFHSPEHTTMASAALFHRRQEQNETVAQYSIVIEKLV